MASSHRQAGAFGSGTASANESDVIQTLRTLRAGQRLRLDCGGKRSATPLWIRRDWQVRAGRCQSHSGEIQSERPAEELYDLSQDPWQMTNVAADSRYSERKAKLRAETRPLPRGDKRPARCRERS